MAALEAPRTEFFAARLYTPPGTVREAVGKTPRVLDLGGGGGLFAKRALTVWPDAAITSYEADPNKAAELDRVARKSGKRWTVEAAAAWVTDSVFVLHAGFDEVAGRSRGRGEHWIRAVDAFPLLADADLARINIGGHEWTLLEDSRFDALELPALLLECHPSDSRGRGVSILRAAGYETQLVADAPMVWAWRY